MDVYAHRDAKTLVRLRLKELQDSGSSLTLRKIADRVPMQYTYLSRLLNRDDVHFSEDQLYAIADTLRFSPSETDYLLLLRAYETTERPDRRAKLLERIEKLRREKKLKAISKAEPLEAASTEMEYLLDPFCVLVYVALSIPSYRKDPRVLATALGLTIPKMKSVLKKLEKLNAVQLARDGMTVEALSPANIHYGIEHPLMRVHQYLLRAPSLHRLQLTPEEKKQSFMVTFTMDEKGFDRAKLEFRTFVKKIEEIAGKSRPTKLYQMSFDLFEWA